MRKVSLCFCLVMGLAVCLKADAMRIAIMDLKANNGVSESTAQAVSDIVRSEMINLQRYTIIERGQIDAILTEQGFQQSGCVETECAVQMGQLLSAQYIIVGSVAQFGTAYNINIRLVNVQEGSALAAEQVTSQNAESIPSDIQILVSRLDARLQNKPLPSYAGTGSEYSQREREAVTAFNIRMINIKKNLYQFRLSKSYLIALSSNISLDKRVEIYTAFCRKDQLTGCLLNGFGLGIGSFVQGDTGCGIITLLGTVTFVTLLASSSTDQALIFLALNLLLSDAEAFIYIGRWNKMLTQALRLNDISGIQSPRQYAYNQPHICQNKGDMVVVLPVYYLKF